MKPKPKSRKDKIAFLRDLQNGKASIKDLSPPHQESWWIQREDEPDRLVNNRTGEEITEAEMQRREKANPNVKYCKLILPGKNGLCLVDLTNVINL